MVAYKDMVQPKNFWVIGDIHGNYGVVSHFYHQNKHLLSKDFRENVLIVLGDFGGNYFLNKRDDGFKDALEEGYPLTYFVIRGNHEYRPSDLAKKWPSDWHTETYFGNTVYVEDRHPRIMYALDGGGEYIINGKSVLVAPGAYSVDKDYRLSNGLTWNPTEQLTKEEINSLLNLANGKHYDYILSHTCPISWIPYIQDLFLSQVDQSTVDNTMEYFLEDLLNSITYDKWYFGHYHANRDIAEMGTMVFQFAIPFGDSIASYQKHCLTN